MAPAEVMISLSSVSLLISGQQQHKRRKRQKCGENIVNLLNTRETYDLVLLPEILDILYAVNSIACQ